MNFSQERSVSGRVLLKKAEYQTGSVSLYAQATSPVVALGMVEESHKGSEAS